MNNTQKAFMRRQVARVRKAKAKLDREQQTYAAMLVLHDERFADPKSGIRFDDEACVIVEPKEPVE